MAELADKLHAERVAGGTQNVDCWACEAAKSPTIVALQQELRRAEGRAYHAEAVLDRAVPDEEAQMQLWRAHWHAEIEARRVPQETTKVEERPDDDPAPVATCNGRDCGGRPHA